MTSMLLVDYTIYLSADKPALYLEAFILKEVIVAVGLFIEAFYALHL